MHLSRRALLLAAACLPHVARAAGDPTLLCPLTTAPTVLIPGLSDALATRLVGCQLYRGLLRWGPDGALEPDLATVEASPDGLTYTAELRPDVTWHDSGGVTSADVAFSLTRFHRALQPGLRLGRITVDTPGPLTVVLTLPAPDPAFPGHLSALSLPIVPQHVHDRAGWALDPRQTTPVGTGPFRYDGWLRLVRFEWYAGPKPSLAAVEFPIMPEAAARTALAAGAGPVLLVGDAVDLPSVPRMRALAGLAVSGEYPTAARSIAGLRFNLAAHPLDQPEVRLALACAIDRNAVLREGWFGLGRVATGPLVSGCLGRHDAASLPAYSPRLAADHLRAAGLRPDDTGIRARLTCLYPPGPTWPPMLGSIRRSLAQVGIDLTAEPLTDADWRRRLMAGDYETTVFAADQSGDPTADLAVYAKWLPALKETPITQAQEQIVAEMLLLPLVEPAMPVVCPARLQLPRGALGSFEGASLA